MPVAQRHDRSPEPSPPAPGPPSGSSPSTGRLSVRSATERARRAVALLRSVLPGAPPGSTSGPDAAELAEILAEAERIAAAAKLGYARRVEVTDAHRRTGHRDAASWLAAVSGEPVGRARRALGAAEVVGRSPTVRAAFEDGALSAAQAGLVGHAAALRPAATEELLATARHGSFRELRDLASRTSRLARGEEGEQAREARAHRGRYCRVWEPDAGGVRLDAWLSKRVGAKLLVRLERETDIVFEEARSSAAHEPRERYRADALARLAGREGGTAPGAHVLVRVDASALRRGRLADGEACEIAGVGQVPVATARSLLGDAFFNVLVSDGIDVTTVTSTKRTVPRALRIALIERDRTCVVPGCPVTDHLEIDHWRVDYAQGGPTALHNLARLCGRHHAMKTTLGWKLAGGPGRWRWFPPRPLRT